MVDEDDVVVAVREVVDLELLPSGSVILLASRVMMSVVVLFTVMTSDVESLSGAAVVLVCTVVMSVVVLWIIVISDGKLFDVEEAAAVTVTVTTTKPSAIAELERGTRDGAGISFCIFISVIGAL